jgi:hypothetical protein
MRECMKAKMREWENWGKSVNLWQQFHKSDTKQSNIY